MSSAEKWWREETVALVTGANKGIGFEVARQLCENGITVILTARNEERGRATLQSLRDQGFQHNLEFFPFDVTSEESAYRLAEWIKQTYGKLDILINNAALNGVKIDMEYLKAHQISLLEAMKLKDADLREKLSRTETLTEDFIDNVVYRFLEDVKSGSYPKKINNVWPEKHATYRVSKMALNAYSRILAQRLAPTNEEKVIYVNCVHPGLIKTDLIFNGAGEPPLVGAANIVKVALLPPPHLLTGQIFIQGELGDFITESVLDFPK